MSKELITRLECIFLAEGEGLNNPHFLSLIDFCEVNDISLENYIIEQGKKHIKNTSGNVFSKVDYDMLTRKGLESLLGKNYKKGMENIKTKKMCDKCIYRHRYRISGICSNLYKEEKKEVTQITSLSLY